ncbi:hypothetical protein ACQP1O_42845 (plasmid) [Nocardia sp. CA-151230]|uniref:hypothetical protein n=1 Tax=Nocardia sp. CA-151230 TaxID=3239982 RepID=UPI003D91F1D7
MTETLIALLIWAVLSVPGALLLARMIRVSSLPADSAQGGEAASPAQPRETDAGEASNFRP